MASMRIRVLTIALATMTIIYLVGCSAGNDAGLDNDNAAESSTVTGSDTKVEPEEVNYYQPAKLMSLGNPGILDMLESSNLEYAEDGGERYWYCLRDDVVGKYDLTRVELGSQEMYEEWGESIWAPKSELVLESFEIDKVWLTLFSSEPEASFYNSRETASLLADEIVDACGLSGQTEEKFDSEKKKLSRSGAFKYGDKRYQWELDISESPDEARAFLDVHRLWL